MGFLNSEKRENKGSGYEAVISCENLDSGIFFDARMYSTKRSGLYLESDIPLNKEDTIFIGLNSSPYIFDPNSCQFYKAKIKWREDLRNSSYQHGYGIQFIHSIIFSDEQNLNKNARRKDMKKIGLRNNHHTRQYLRKHYPRLIFFNSQNKYFKGFINNISHGGIFIETKDNFTIGQVVKVFIPSSKLGKGLILHGEVARLAQKGIGLKFKKNEKGQIIQYI